MTERARRAVRDALSMSEQVLIMGWFDIDPAKRDAALELFKRMNKGSIEEPGCVRYAFSADLDDPNRFHLYECWADEAALETHFEAALLQEFRRLLPDLLVERSVTRWLGTEAPLG